MNLNDTVNSGNHPAAPSPPEGGGRPDRTPIKRASTIKDISRIAKVSPTAVSMALNDRPGVSAKTRKRILKIARQVGYKPNYLAKGLIQGRSYTLGLIINNIADPFYPELALGIEEKAWERGYSVVLYNINRSIEKEKASLDLLRAKGVDGVIVTTATVDDPNIAVLVKDRFPFVLVNRRALEPQLNNKIDYVVLDNLACGRTAVEHLYRLGHDRVALIAGAPNTSTATFRTRGAHAFMNEHGMDTDPKLTVHCGYSRSEAHQAAVRLLSLKPRPTALFCQDDHMALGVREAVLESGLRIPEDIALVGVDDVDMASLRGVDLTTISQNTYQMGALGVEILINKIENKTTAGVVNKVVFEANLVVRKSCGYHLRGYVR